MIKKQNFKNFISDQSNKSLESFILSLFDSSEAFRNIMSSATSQDDAETLFDTYEKKLDDCFKIESFSLEAAREVLSEFSSLPTNPASIADMNLAFAEDAVWLTNEFGDFEDGFYDTIVDAGLRVIEYCKEDSGYLEEREDRIEKLIHECGAFGFGVYDDLKAAYEEIAERY